MLRMNKCCIDDSQKCCSQCSIDIQIFNCNRYKTRYKKTHFSLPNTQTHSWNVSSVVLLFLPLMLVYRGCQGNLFSLHKLDLKSHKRLLYAAIYLIPDGKENRKFHISLLLCCLLHSLMRSCFGISSSISL